MPKPYTKKGEKTSAYHIIFDGYDIDAKLLDDEQFIMSLMLDIPKLAGFAITSGPNVVRHADKKISGISGFAIIGGAHLSIHAFASTKEIYVDMFTLKKFDDKKVYKFLCKKLRVKRMDTMQVKYPWEK